MYASVAIMVLSLLGIARASWSVNCGSFQTSQAGPVDNTSNHFYQFNGPLNASLDSAYDDLQASSCTSCDVQADKSAYWVPQLFYEHSNGSLEKVPGNLTIMYHHGHGGEAANIKPFPPGFRMLSSDPLAHSISAFATNDDESHVIANPVQSSCLASPAVPNTAGMDSTGCVKNSKLVVYFQSCWNGRDLYKEDGSHVAYSSGISHGVCPPSHPIQLMHLSYEISYNLQAFEHEQQQSGRFVFAERDHNPLSEPPHPKVFYLDMM